METPPPGKRRFVALAPWPSAWRRALDAAAVAADAGRALRPLLREVGFDNLSCIVLPQATGGRERAVAFWSTHPPGWVQRYRGCGLATFDPRVTLTATRLAPIIWDAADLESQRRLRPFLVEARRAGIRSGFAVSFRDAPATRTVVTFDSGESPMSEERCAAIIAALGDLMLLAAALHERVLRSRCERLTVPASPARGGLTRRERQCLDLASRGLTSGDMGNRLGIAERTVNFHIQNLLRKLQASNRSEAIARAVARGVLEAGGGT